MLELDKTSTGCVATIRLLKLRTCHVCITVPVSHVSNSVRWRYTGCGKI